MSQERTVWLPWNSFYAMDTLVMKTEENSIPSCDLSGFVRPDPIIISSPLSTFFSASPASNPIVPETQVGTGPRAWKVYSILPKSIPTAQFSPIISVSPSVPGTNIKGEKRNVEFIATVGDNLNPSRTFGMFTDSRSRLWQSQELLIK